MVVDTSALLAVIFDEPHAAWVLSQFRENTGELSMSTVNLAETLMLVRRRRLDDIHAIEDDLLSAGIQFIPPTVEQAQLAVSARHRFPLNIGDCFVYALSVTQDRPILTLDEDFRRCDRPVVIPATQHGR